MKLDIKKYVSPVFVALLVLAVVMWYFTKLSYTYTAEIPVDVTIGNNTFRVMCVAEGQGYRILAHRTFHKSRLTLAPGDVQMTPSVMNRDGWVVNPFSLQNAISVSNSDVRIISIGDIPEITLSGR